MPRSASQENRYNSESTELTAIRRSARDSARKLHQRYGSQINDLEQVVQTIKSYLETLDNNVVNSAAYRFVSSNPHLYVAGSIQIDGVCSIKYLIASVWLAVNDVDMICSKLQEDPNNLDEMGQVKQTAIDQAKQHRLGLFVEALYECQRTNNLQYNSDDGDYSATTYQDDGRDDKPACANGTFNKLIEKLVGLHDDCYIIQVTPGQLSERLPSVADDIVTQYFKNQLSQIDRLQQLQALVLSLQNSDDANNEVWPRLKESIKQRLWKEEGAPYIYSGYDDPNFQALIAYCELASLNHYYRALGQFLYRSDNDGSQLDHYSEIHWLAYKGDVETIKSGLDQDPNQATKRNANDDSILAIAALQGNLELVEFLSSNNHCDLNEQDHQGDTVLHKLIKQGHALPIYLINKSDLSVRNHEGKRPLDITGSSGVSYVVDQLTRYEQQRETNQLPAVYLVIQHSNQPDLLRALLDEDSQLNAQQTLIQFAHRMESPVMVKTLLERAHKPTYEQLASVNGNGANLLHVASKQKDLALAKQVMTLLTQQTNDTPLFRRWLQQTSLQKLLKQQDNAGKTALQYADEYEQTDLVNYLISMGGDVHELSDSPQRKARDCLVGFLVKRGYYQGLDQISDEELTQLSFEDNQHKSALFLAAHHGFKEAIHSLLNRKQPQSWRELESRGEIESSSLYEACRQGHKKVVDLLVEHGWDVNFKKSPNQRTPLMQSVLGGYVEIARTLLDNGADSTLRDHAGNLAYHLSRTPQMTELLRSYMPSHLLGQIRDNNNSSFDGAGYFSNMETALTSLLYSAALNLTTQNADLLVRALRDQFEELDNNISFLITDNVHNSYGGHNTRSNRLNDIGSRYTEEDNPLTPILGITQHDSGNNEQENSDQRAPTPGRRGSSQDLD